MARKGLGDRDRCVDDLETILELEPGNEVALSELSEVRNGAEQQSDVETSNGESDSVAAPLWSKERDELLTHLVCQEEFRFDVVAEQMTTLMSDSSLDALQCRLRWAVLDEAEETDRR